MSRNNNDRLGVSDPNVGAEMPQNINTPQPQSQQQPSSPLSFVTPTEFVELPSGGKYYDEGHPLHGKTVIEIKHMTTREEDILTSQALLKQNKAMDRFLQQMILDSRINVDDLLVGDKNAILIAARKTGYGAEYTTSIECPACTKTVKHNFSLDLTTISSGTPDDELGENISRTNNNTFITSNLPVTKWSIEMRLLNSADEKKIIETAEGRRKRGLPEDLLSAQLSSFIVSIEGVTNRGQINSAIQSMPAKDSRFLREAYSKVIPSIDLTQEFACSECGYSGDMEVPFTTDFFWPES